MTERTEKDRAGYYVFEAGWKAGYEDGKRFMQPEIEGLRARIEQLEKEVIVLTGGEVEEEADV